MLLGGGGLCDLWILGREHRGEDTPKSRDFYPPQAVVGAGDGKTPAGGLLFL